MRWKAVESRRVSAHVAVVVDVVDGHEQPGLLDGLLHAGHILEAQVADVVAGSLGVKHRQAVPDHLREQEAAEAET